MLYKEDQQLIILQQKVSLGDTENSKKADFVSTNAVHLEKKGRA